MRHQSRDEQIWKCSSTNLYKDMSIYCFIATKFLPSCFEFPNDAYFSNLTAFGLMKEKDNSKCHLRTS